MNNITANCMTPIGNLIIEASDTALTRVYYGERVESGEVNAVITAAIEQLNDYFKGERQSFDLPLNQVGTPFQLQVWHQLGQIAYGTTATYQQIAEQVGNPRAYRAVGTANGQNPISIIVPCHRVIGSDGRLHGYAGGENRKEWLIKHEQQHRK